MTMADPQLVRLQAFDDPLQGNLCIATAEREVPFRFPRLFFMHGLKAGMRRGDHAHRAQHQFLIAMHGRFDVTWVHAGGSGKITLADPRQGLHVPPLTWIALEALVDDAICLVLASDIYDEADYIRNRAEFDRLIAR